MWTCTAHGINLPGLRCIVAILQDTAENKQGNSSWWKWFGNRNSQILQNLIGYIGYFIVTKTAIMEKIRFLTKLVRCVQDKSLCPIHSRTNRVVNRELIWRYNLINLQQRKMLPFDDQLSRASPSPIPSIPWPEPLPRRDRNCRRQRLAEVGAATLGSPSPYN